MSSIQYNIFEKQRAKAMLENHPMCFEIREEKSKLIVIFPYEVYGIGGVRVDNTANGIKQAILKCEKAWEDSSLKVSA